MKKLNYRTLIFGLLILPFLSSPQGASKHAPLRQDTLLLSKGFIKDTIALQVMKIHIYRDSLGSAVVERKIKIILSGNSYQCPIPDPEAVKNFSVSAFTIRGNDLAIHCSWGGGKHLYSNVFHFSYKKNNLLLKKVEKQSYGPNMPAKKQNLILRRPIPFEQFSFLNYLD